MPPEDPNAEASLRKLGQRLRSGVAKRHPVSERSRQTVLDAVRAEHQRIQGAQRSLPPAAPAKTPTRQPKPPEPER